MPKRRGVYLKR